LANSVRIIGIDPGLRLTGFGIVDFKNKIPTYIASGVIKTPSNTLDLPSRLKVIFDEVSATIKKYNPSQLCIEKTFVNMNANSSLALGQARGVSMAAAIQNNIDIFEYTALQIKKSVVGNGHAQKIQVQSMVQRLLNLPELLGPDSSDALACILCHYQVMQLKKDNLKLNYKSRRIQ
jgi:crossover junction endodeoxyribonuclease RuvC